MEQHPPSIIILYGATGDLAHRKLYPALYMLYKENLLSDQFAVIGVARRKKTRETFKEDIFQSVQTFSRQKPEDDLEWNQFVDHFDYLSLDSTDREGHSHLHHLIEEKERQLGGRPNRVFYLAIAPNLIKHVTLNLQASGLTDPPHQKALVIEKPFGHDYDSAKALNDEISQVFREEEIYRIDHYLGKEMIQNINIIRFANIFFEPLWNRHYIANVQITSSETVGVGDRGDYYEHSGAMRDMFQNHMLQMLMLIAMEPPNRLDTEAVRDEKVKVLSALRQPTAETIPHHFIRGQYGTGTLNGDTVAAYNQEPKISPVSVRDTFVAAKVNVDNARWAGVPFYIRTGKRMPVKTTEIVVQFKDLPRHLTFNQTGQVEPNLLRIRIQPEEGVSLQLNAKQPGATETIVIPVELDFRQSGVVGINSPEAYERLLFDCLNGDSTFFTRWDEVAYAWQFCDPVLKFWTENPPSDFPNYESGTWGPPSADELPSADGFQWLTVQD